MRQQKYTNEQYLYAAESYFEPDEWISHEQNKIVKKTRTPHECMGVDHKGDQIIPVGSMAFCQTAIHIDAGRVSCYVCQECLEDWASVLFPDDEDDEEEGA